LVRGFSPSYTEEAILVKFGIAKKTVASSRIEVNRGARIRTLQGRYTRTLQDRARDRQETDVAAQREWECRSAATATGPGEIKPKWKWPVVKIENS